MYFSNVFFVVFHIDIGTDFQLLRAQIRSCKTNQRPAAVPSSWRSWMRHCATSRKVAGLISHWYVEIFYSPNPSSRIRALGTTQFVTQINTRELPWK